MNAAPAKPHISACTHGYVDWGKREHAQAEKHAPYATARSVPRTMYLLRRNMYLAYVAGAGHMSSISSAKVKMWS